MRHSYYSVRSGTHPSSGKLTLAMLRRVFVEFYEDFKRLGYLQQNFGYYCVDADFVEGHLGPHVDRYVFRLLKKDGVWPPNRHTSSLTEDDIFDLLEFLHDHVAKGVEGQFHSYEDCGWHYTLFDPAQGRADFIDAANTFLRDYGSGYKLNPQGEVVELAPSGIEDLEDAALPASLGVDLVRRVRDATRKFKRRGAPVSDRRDAIRDLVDVLEYLRPKAKAHLVKKDESDLFEIANSFGIRHNRAGQKTSYDADIWFSWMFYHYLSSIHALTRIIERESHGR